MRRLIHPFWLLVGAALAASTGGCSDLGYPVGAQMMLGEYGQARALIAEHQTTDKSDRQYMLDRMRLAIATMDDGYPQLAQGTFEEVYNILRTQGINADKTVASVVINEGVKFWKGEPFEQAMGFLYYSLQQASLDHWDNARAAAQNALFHLKDFGADTQGQRMDTLEIAQRSAESEHAPGAAPGQPPKDYLNSGYAVRDSNFTLGYLMNGLANQQLGRDREARDNYAVAVQTGADVAPLVDELQAGAFNTVLVVAYGTGPRKVAYGPDRALTRFVSIMPTDRQRLLVWMDSPAPGGGRVNSGGAGGSKAYAPVCDLNQMAADHMWNNLEDVRVAKAYIGQFLTVAGVGALGVGAAEHSKEAMWAGLGAALAGVALQASAHADTRYCDLMPQRFYLVPLNLPDANAIIHLQLEGLPGTQLALLGLAPPTGQVAGQPKAQLRYVRLVGGPYVPSTPPTWATSAHIYYANDVSGDTDPGSGGSGGGQPIFQAGVPYILGGNSVRTPSTEALQTYNRAGYLVGMTPAELENLYRTEGIDFGQGPPQPSEKHVLEGGKLLVPPLAGTAGFARLFGQLHAPYQPQSALVRDLGSRLQHPQPPPDAPQPAPVAPGTPGSPGTAAPPPESGK
jgi:hypothetical protein